MHDCELFPPPDKNYNPYNLPITNQFTLTDYNLLSAKQKNEFITFMENSKIGEYKDLPHSKITVENEKSLRNIYLNIMAFDGTAKTSLQKMDEAFEIAFASGKKVIDIYTHIKKKYGHMDRSPYGHSWESFYQRAAKRRQQIIWDEFRHHYTRHSFQFMDRIGFL